ncbi:MAG: hypothetical protein Q8S54_01235 [Bacteroidota bacterium]|nr:hypothetical protein [Bacteroidota bacterium]
MNKEVHEIKEKDEYDKLIGFFKTLVWLSMGAIAFVSAFAGITFISDHKDLKERIGQVEKDATNSITRVEKHAKFKIDSLNSVIENKVDSKVDLELERIFQTERIEILIQNKILDNVEGKLKTLANIEYEKFYKRIQSDIMVLDEIDYHFRRIIEDQETGDNFRKLVDLYENAQNNDIKQIALSKLRESYKDHYSSVQNMDYEKIISTYFNNVDFQDKEIAEKFIKESLIYSSDKYYILLSVRLYNLKYNTDFQPYEYKKILKNLESK